jgi:hypothetical protein
MYTEFWSKKLKGRNDLKDLGIGGKIILEWILNSLGGCGLNSSGSGWGEMADCCEHGNEPLCFIKGREFLE